MTRYKAICIVGVLLFGMAVMAGSALARGEGGSGDPVELFIAQYVNPGAPGVVLNGKIYIRYSILDPYDDSYGCSGDYPTNMFFQTSLRLGPENWTFFGYGGVACYTTGLETQMEAVKTFISTDVIPNVFRGTPRWAFKSITNVQQLPIGTTSYPDAVEFSLLADYSIAVQGGFGGR